MSDISRERRKSRVALVRTRANERVARPIAPTTPWPVRDTHITFRDVRLESGAVIDAIDVRYRLEGAISSARDNVVLVIHALTGTPEPVQWWRGVVERGGAVDPTRHAVLSANLLGGCYGTTGPRDEGAELFPACTTRDQAALLARLLDALGIHAPLLVCGGSLGGLVTLEFAASFPDRVRGAVVLAAPAAQTAQGLAWNTIMRNAIALGGAKDGLALARQIGMLSYRTPRGLEQRFGRARSDDGTFLVNDWLQAHGSKLVRRFDAASYLALIDAMDSHDVGLARGGISAALAPVADRLTGVGIPGDQLYPADTVREWTQQIGAHYVELPSIHGHDAFLLESARVSDILRAALIRAAGHAPRNPPTPSNPPTPNTPRKQNNPRNPRTAPPLRVALAGCGHVGGSLLNLLVENNASPAARRVLVERVLVRDSARPRASLLHAAEHNAAATSTCVTNPDDLLGDDTDVLVELIGGTTTARTLVESALRRGIRVITANKALLAERGPELQQLAATHHTRIDFEGAVAGAIPVIRCIRSGAVGEGVHAFSAILNGTGNFVLDRASEGASLAEAVAEAQRLGYAEADPSRDLSGEDTEDKLRVLAWLLFGVPPRSIGVERRGIDVETAAWASHVAATGDRVKLLATCTREHDRVVAHVAPVRVAHNDPWASVQGAGNRIVIHSESAGALVFHGVGAGGRATAGTVLADLLNPFSGCA